MRRMLLAIERDWEMLKLQHDVEILHEYSERGRQFSTIYASTETNYLEN